MTGIYNFILFFNSKNLTCRIDGSTRQRDIGMFLYDNTWEKKSSNCVVLNFQLSLKERRKKTNKKQWQTLERFIFQLWLKIIKKIIIYLLEYKNLFLA